MAASNLDAYTYEKRAVDAEKRLAAIESKLAAGGGAAINTAAYISQLEALKAIMIEAKTEQQQLEQRVAELTADNAKLAYQAKHLKRALEEADAKLAGN